MDSCRQTAPGKRACFCSDPHAVGDDCVCELGYLHKNVTGLCEGKCFVGSWLVRWFVCSLVRWFTGSLILWFVGLLVR